MAAELAEGSALRALTVYRGQTAKSGLKCALGIEKRGGPGVVSRWTVTLRLPAEVTCNGLVHNQGEGGHGKEKQPQKACR